MDLSFYESLNPQQKAFANRIADRAKAMGIPPELAVAVAYQESRLNPSVQAGSAGEIGIMQIKPNTAKEMGFSLEDIKSPEKNIDAGLKYLKRSLDLSEGDPRLAAAGYNAGINHPFFSSQDKSLPTSTVNYLRDLKGFGAFSNVPEARISEAPVEPKAPQARTEVDEVFEQAARGKGELAGLGIGAGEAFRRTIGPAVKGAAQFIGKASEEGKLAADAKAGILPETPPVPPTPPGGQPPATQLSTAGTYGKATGPGSATFNYGRSYGLPEIEAGKALNTTKEAGGVWDLLNKRQEALTGIQQRFPTETYVENPRFGGLMTPGQGVGAGPKASFVQQPGGLQALPPKAPVPLTPPAKGALEEVTDIFKRMIEPGSKARSVIGTGLKYAAPPLAGLQAGSETGAMLSELDRGKPDYTKATLHGLGALGAGLSAFPATAPVGLPLAISAPLFVEAIEKGRDRPLGQLSDMMAP